MSEDQRKKEGTMRRRREETFRIGRKIKGIMKLRKEE